MTKRIRVNVTQDDIDRGLRGVSTRCPIARALRRRTGEVYAVCNGHRERVDGSSVEKNNLRVETFVINFDRGLPVGPMYFYTRITA